MAKNQPAKITPPPSAPGSKGQLFTWAIIFVIGFLCGIAFTVYKGGSISQPPVATKEAQAPPHNEEMHQAILSLEAEVTTNPQNFQAWVRLGNLYYDTDQAAKAIAAYSKSLELDKGDANIITDLGVMYRKNKEPQKAIEQFNRAIKENPGHLPSRYNKGIVLLYDLKDPQSAIATWEEMLTIDPQAKTTSGMAIRDLIAQVKAEQSTSK